MLCKGEMVGFVDEFRAVIDNRLQEIDCWGDRLEIMTHGNGDRKVKNLISDLLFMIKFAIA